MPTVFVRRSPVRRAFTAIAAVPLLAVGLAACGDDSSGDGKGGDGGGAGPSVAEGETVEAGDFVDGLAAAVDGSSAAFTFAVGAADDETKGSGEIDYSTDPASLRMTFAGGAEDGYEALLVDGIMYVQSAELPDGEYWRVDPSDPTSVMGALGAGSGFNQGDPVAALQAMENGIESVTFVGPESVDGRDLDHYELKVDMAAALQAGGSAMQQGLAESMAESMPDDTAYDVWLDGDGRPARMTSEMELLGQTMTSEITTDDWGRDVTVEAPPADVVSDMPSLDEMLEDLDDLTASPSP